MLGCSWEIPHLQFPNTVNPAFWRLAKENLGSVAPLFEASIATKYGALSHSSRKKHKIATLYLKDSATKIQGVDLD